MKSKGTVGTSLTKVKEAILFRRFLGASVVGMAIFVLAFTVVPYLIAEANATDATTDVTWKTLSLLLDPDVDATDSGDSQIGDVGHGDIDFGEVIPTSVSGDNVGTQKVVKKKIGITSTGNYYAVYLSMSGDNNRLVREGDTQQYISAVSGTWSAPGAFTTTGWGYAVPTNTTKAPDWTTPFDAGETGLYGGYDDFLVDLDVPNTNNLTATGTGSDVYNTGTWAAVPVVNATQHTTAQQIWKNSTNAAEGFANRDTFEIYYAVMADIDTMAGTYSNSVVYTALASSSSLDRASTNLSRDKEYVTSNTVETIEIDLATVPSNALTTSDVVISVVPHATIAGLNYNPTTLNTDNYAKCTPTAISSVGKGATITCTMPAIGTTATGDGNTRGDIVIADSTTTVNGEYDFWVHVNKYDQELDYVSKYTSGNDNVAAVYYVGLQSKKPVYNNNNEVIGSTPYITTMQEMEANVCKNTNMWGSVMNTTSRSNDALIYDYRGDGGVTINSSDGTLTPVNEALASTSVGSEAVGLGTFVLGDNRETVASGGQAGTGYKTYLVRRLADGNCWMVQNLDLNLRKFANTDNLNKDNTDLQNSGRASWDPAKSAMTDYSTFAAWSAAHLGNSQTTQFLTNTEFGLDGSTNTLYYWGSKCSALNDCNLTDVTNNKMAQIPRSYDNDPENASHQPTAIYYTGGTGVTQYGTESGTNTSNTSYGVPGLYHNTNTWSPETKNGGDDSIMLGTRYFGDYYNWYAATAETGTRNMSESQYHNGAVAYDSICPKGWKLPTNHGTSTADSWQNLIYTNYRYVALADSTYSLVAPGNNAATSQSMRLLPLSIPFTGNYDWQTAALNNRGSYGRFWSSTAYNSGDHTHAYYLNFSGSNVDPQNYVDKVLGLTIRCVAR